MLHQPTIEKLMSMRLQGMVSALEEMEQQEAAADLSFAEKLALLVDRQYTRRQNLAFQQRLRRARLRSNACVEDIDYRAFVELVTPQVQSVPECTLEVEGRGGKLRIQLRGASASYLATCEDGIVRRIQRGKALSPVPHARAVGRAESEYRGGRRVVQHLDS